MALGAFLAGLLLAETEFSLQVESDIAPYRGLLLGLFFMTVNIKYWHLTVYFYMLQLASSFGHLTVYLILSFSPQWCFVVLGLVAISFSSA